MLNEAQKKELKVIAKGTLSSPGAHADPFIGETEGDINLEKKNFFALLFA